jgi:hypothetical protein
VDGKIVGLGLGAGAAPALACGTNAEGSELSASATEATLTGMDGVDCWADGGKTEATNKIADINLGAIFI